MPMVWAAKSKNGISKIEVVDQVMVDQGLYLKRLRKKSEVFHNRKSRVTSKRSLVAR